MRRGLGYVFVFYVRVWLVFKLYRLRWVFWERVDEFVEGGGGGVVDRFYIVVRWYCLRWGFRI